MNGGGGGGGEREIERESKSERARGHTREGGKKEKTESNEINFVINLRREGLTSFSSTVPMPQLAGQPGTDQRLQQAPPPQEY